MSETWFRDSETYAFPPDYDIIRSDRKTRGGGVAILYKKDFKVRNMDFQNIDWLQPTSLETVCVSIQLRNNKSFIVCCIYRTKNATNDLHNLDTLFEHLSLQHKLVYILGDFNFNLYSTNSNCCKFNNLIYKYSFTQIVNQPTRGKSLLDVILTNTPSSVLSNHNYDSPISDHQLVYLVTNVKLSKSQVKTIVRRDYNNIDWEGLTESLNVLQIQSSDCSTATTEVINHIISTFDYFAPNKEHKLRSAMYNPTPRTKRMIFIRDFHKKQFRLTGQLYSSNQFKKYRRIVKLCVANDKSKFLDAKTKIEGAWKMFKNFFRPSKRCHILSNLTLNDINNFFCHCAFLPNQVICDSILNYESPPTNTEEFTVTKITKSDLYLAWRGIKHKSSKTTDFMGISTFMMDSILPLPIIHESILCVANMSFSSGVIPKQLKTTKVVPIPKVNDPKSVNEFRPISVTNVLMLLLEKVYLNKLSSYVTDNNFSDCRQFGFKKHHSTEHAVIALTDSIREHLDKGGFCVLVSIDLRKAFDSVPRGKLLMKLKNQFKISDHWLKSYLSDRWQYVQLDGETSDLSQTLRGVPQGSVLGPELFSLYINDLPNCLVYAKANLFADDTLGIFSGMKGEEDQLQQKVNEDMKAILKWSEINELPLNEGKTKVMKIGGTNLSKPLTISINSVIVNCVSEFKYLGIVIDDKLSWQSHINMITKACFIRIRTLYTIRDYFSTETLIILGQSLVLSLISYMSAVWGSATKNVLASFEKTIRSLGRLIFRKRKFDKISNLITHDLQWLFPTYLSSYNTLCIMYKIRNYNIPFFVNYYTTHSDNHGYSTRNCNELRLPFTPKTKFGPHCFNFRSVVLWNKLPSDIRNSSSYSIFRKSLKAYYISIQGNDCV